MSTLDGYGQIMFDALDVVGVDKQPRQDNNPAAFLFFAVNPKALSPEP